MNTRKVEGLAALIALLAYGLILAGCGAGSGLVTEAQAQTQTLSPTGCSASALAGAYGLVEQWTVLAPLPGFPPPPFPVVDTALIMLDGSGHFTGSVTANDGGVPVSTVFDGLYTVNGDCTFTAQYTPALFPITLHLSGVIVGQGMKQEIHYMYTDAILVGWGGGWKTAPGGCSAASLNGAYSDSEQGMIVAGFGAPPAYPAAGTGILTFDGKGNFTANELLSFGGVVSPEAGAGTYTVNADCTYKDVFTDASGYTAHDAGIITGQGEYQELHTIYFDPGVVVAGASKKQ